MQNKKSHPKIKTRLHRRSKHRERYDFKQLIESYPELSPFVTTNAYGDESVDFFDPKAVKALNIALLKHYYSIDYWDIPEHYLVPPIPGRADYIHHIADVLSSKTFGKIPQGDSVKCLDIGVGANCIYPIIGTKEYDWNFVGTEIDPAALNSAKHIIEANPNLNQKVELRLQAKSDDVFFGVINLEERFDISMCNPPFHASQKEAEAVSLRKLSNLTHQKVTEKTLNFGGRSNELWCDGGEEKFIKNMIRESKYYAQTCLWFSTLVSKQSSLKNAYQALKKAEAVEVKTIPMGQGNKSSRIVAWTFLSEKEQKEWAKTRWENENKAT
ncbi:MAG: 23S rRNA (adenine(1618)-N(6))-methyltransferase RlmF [Bacteroidales bacterium]|nr:23S rRNA (adenine(1618)-N(6))-methyltransferase RlmF [Bacteroidales bacterium]